MIKLFGIRHHGPGSARSLRHALQSYSPDVVLIEGPPDADSVLPLAAHAEMEPPVAILIYVPDEPLHSALYPFARFSPEWNAIGYGLAQGVPVRFMDLPQTHMLAWRKAKMDEASAEVDTEKEEKAEEVSQPLTPDPIRMDPLRYLAEAAGYSDSERWWEHMVELRRAGEDTEDLFAIFTAIAEGMGALREAAGPEMPDSLEPMREAHMRKTIRVAQR